MSLLKKAHGVTQTINSLSSVENISGLLFLPETIVEHKLAMTNNKVVVIVLVRWRDQPLTDVTWEFLYDLQVQFPDFDM